MAYKEPKLNKDDIQALYDVLGSVPERSKKGRKPGTVKRSGSKKTTGKK